MSESREARDGAHQNKPTQEFLQQEEERQDHSMVLTAFEVG